MAIRNAINQSSENDVSTDINHFCFLSNGGMFHNCVILFEPPPPSSSVHVRDDTLVTATTIEKAYYSSKFLPINYFYRYNIRFSNITFVTLFYSNKVFEKLNILNNSTHILIKK